MIEINNETILIRVRKKTDKTWTVTTYKTFGECVTKELPEEDAQTLLKLSGKTYE